MRKFLDIYRTTAILLLNTVLVVGLFNAVLSIAFRIRDESKTNPIFARYGESAVLDAYEVDNASTVSIMLDETWSLGFEYEPFTQFRQEAYEGRYVNVDANGYRLSSDQGPWPVSHDGLNVFVFGGSTTFGYGVSDDQTVASFIQRQTAAKVYNFGRAHYYSSQEFALFGRLLAKGHVPDLAIFVDGLNEFYYSDDQPGMTKDLTAHVAKFNPLFTLISQTAFSRFAKGIGYRLAKEPPPRPVADPEPIIDRYFANKRMIEGIATAYGVRVLFVWQPIPMHGELRGKHPFYKDGLNEHKGARAGYKAMENRLAGMGNVPNFIDCSGIQSEIDGILYVDSVHYSPRMNEFLAKKICERMKK